MMKQKNGNDKGRGKETNLGERRGRRSSKIRLQDIN
jgi:hypothetical protein